MPSLYISIVFFCYPAGGEWWQLHGWSTLLGCAYHALTISLPFPYHVLTICYMCRIDSKMWGEPFWGCWGVHIMSLPFPDHFLTISWPSATCAELTARCEGTILGLLGCADHVLTISLPFPDHLLTICVPFPMLGYFFLLSWFKTAGRWNYFFIIGRVTIGRPNHAVGGSLCEPYFECVCIKNSY